MIFVSDIGTATISEVNPTTGVVTTFSGNGVGTGPAVIRPFQMAFNSSGTLFVADGGHPDPGFTTALYAVDSQGNRTLVAGNNGSSDNVFNHSLQGLALDANGNIFVSATISDTIYSVTSGGTATPLSSSVVPPLGLAFSNGQLLAAGGNGGISSPAIFSIDPTTGTATILSDNSGSHGSGPSLINTKGITVAPDGTIYVTNTGTGGADQIFKVDPATGNRSVVSGNGVGGTTFGSLDIGIAVYPSVSSTAAVPEPASLTLLATGALGLLGYGWRRRRQSA